MRETIDALLQPIEDPYSTSDQPFQLIQGKLASPKSQGQGATASIHRT